MTSLLIKMDVIRCPVNAGLNFRGTKLSRMAVEPRKPQKFSTAKIKVHTVYARTVMLQCLTVGPTKIRDKWLADLLSQWVAISYLMMKVSASRGTSLLRKN